MPQPRKHANAASRQAAYRARQDAVRRDQLRQKGLPGLPALPQMPGTLRWKAAIQMALTLLERTADEMRDYYDERSEAWQESERGDEHQERIDGLDSLIGEFDNIA